MREERGCVECDEGEWRERVKEKREKEQRRVQRKKEGKKKEWSG